MELRVLQYFLTVVREGSITGAAEALNLSQPTLSRQIRDMEDELGKPLMVRGSRKITLTEEGMILRKRAEEIMELVGKAESEIALSDDCIAGDVYVGAGETDGVRFLTKAARQLQSEYPNIHYHIFSGDKADIQERLDKGLIDFGLFLGTVDLAKYDALPLPAEDTWGVLMRRDSPLAKKKSIAPKDLWDKPLILSRQEFDERLYHSGKGMVNAWLKRDFESLNIAATYSLVFNGSLMVNEGLGYALALDNIINVSGDSSLCFRPCSPQLKTTMSVAWKKYQVFSRAAKKYLEKLKAVVESYQAL